MSPMCLNSHPNIISVHFFHSLGCPVFCNEVPSLLFSKVVEFYFHNYSLYGRALKLHVVLVHALCSLSVFLISIIVWGDHVTAAYSSFGQITETISFLIIFNSGLWRLFLCFLIFLGYIQLVSSQVKPLWYFDILIIACVFVLICVCICLSGFLQDWVFFFFLCKIWMVFLTWFPSRSYFTVLLECLDCRIF